MFGRAHATESQRMVQAVVIDRHPERRFLCVATPVADWSCKRNLSSDWFGNE